MQDNNQFKDILYNKNIQVNCDINKPYIPNTQYGGFDIDYVMDGNPNKIHIDINKPNYNLAPEVSMLNTLDKFEKTSWSPTNKGIKSGFTSLDNAFDGGIKPGFTMLAADSNLGKTGMISQIALQVSLYNQDVYVLDFSLDDAMDDKLPRVISCGAKIPLSVSQYPNNYKQYPLMIMRRLQMINKLRNNACNYNVYDIQKICEESPKHTANIEDIFYIILKTMTDLQAAGVNKRLFVALDNFHDLSSEKYKNEDTKYDSIAVMIGEFCDMYKIPFWCTGELRKLNSTRRPILDDIRSNTKIKYKAMCIMLGYNDVHYKGENADVYYKRINKIEKQPVFELHFAKNKLSSFKGRLFFNFLTEMSRMEECTKAEEDIYKAAIYGS